MWCPTLTENSRRTFLGVTKNDLPPVHYLGGGIRGGQQPRKLLHAKTVRWICRTLLGEQKWPYGTLASSPIGAWQIVIEAISQRAPKSLICGWLNWTIWRMPTSSADTRRRFRNPVGPWQLQPTAQTDTTETEARRCQKMPKDALMPKHANGRFKVWPLRRSSQWGGNIHQARKLFCKACQLKQVKQNNCKHIFLFR